MKTLKCLTLLIFIILPTLHIFPQNPPATAFVDERAELVGIVFRLAGAEEYSGCIIEKYSQDIDNYFDKYRDHDVVKLAKEYRDEYGVGYDAVMYIAIHININNSDILLDERVFNKPIEGRWTEERLRLFANKLSDFYKKTNFRKFFSSHADLFSMTENRMNDILHHKMYYPWFNKFWGTIDVDNYNVIASLTNGCSNYGIKLIDNDKSENVFAIIGVCSTDSLNNPVFPLENSISLFVHEINHSYYTVFDKEQFREAGKTIFPLIENRMIDNAYGNWDIVVEEAMVRAAVINYMYKDPVNMYNIDSEIDHQKSIGFFWIANLVKELEVYDNNRDKYPSMASFVPRIVNFYNNLAKKIQIEGFSLPKIENTSIKNGSIIDSSTKELIYTFNKPMRTRGYGFNPGKLGKESMPKFDKIEWINDRNLKLTFDLEKDKEYSIKLFTPAYRDTEGNYLYENVELQFKTSQY